MKTEAVIFDFGRTLYDPVNEGLFPETIPTLRELKDRKLKLGLATVALTDDIELREGEIVDLGLSKFFDSVQVVKRSEGDKSLAIQKILEEFGLSNTPHSCIFVGDNLKRDIAPGNTRGLTTVWTKQRLSGNWNPQNEAQKPKHTINRLAELVPLIDRINK